MECVAARVAALASGCFTIAAGRELDTPRLLPAAGENFEWMLYGDDLTQPLNDPLPSCAGRYSPSIEDERFKYF